MEGRKIGSTASPPPGATPSLSFIANSTRLPILQLQGSRHRTSTECETLGSAAHSWEHKEKTTLDSSSLSFPVTPSSIGEGRMSQWVGKRKRPSTSQQRRKDMGKEGSRSDARETSSGNSWYLDILWHENEMIRVLSNLQACPGLLPASEVPRNPQPGAPKVSMGVEATAPGPFCCLSFSSNFANSARAISSSWSSTCTTPFTSSI